MSNCFPRGTDLPAQSPLFWVTHKDRYLRQLLIKDIEADTSRSLVVYFADCNVAGAQLDGNDDVYVAELLNACPKGGPVDLLLETNGGLTDATEKICAVLRAATSDLRVIVPRRAKSNGTVIAMCGKTIVMGMESELGPIDPSINGVPVEFVLNAPPGTMSVIDLQVAETARKQTQKLASDLLSTGMLKGTAPDEITALVNKIATRDKYHSHGSVIDASEAASLGLHVTNLGQDDPLWRKVGLLRAMYQVDCANYGYAKIFEGTRVSLVVAAPPAKP
ncbi:MAG: hypothetical protein K9J82_01110 [Methylotenera sp.]|nr:hypothetical protein [Methylotenera sp.]